MKMKSSLEAGHSVTQSTGTQGRMMNSETTECSYTVVPSVECLFFLHPFLCFFLSKQCIGFHFTWKNREFAHTVQSPVQVLYSKCQQICLHKLLHLKDILSIQRMMWLFSTLWHNVEEKYRKNIFYGIWRSKTHHLY